MLKKRFYLYIFSIYLIKKILVNKIFEKKRKMMQKEKPLMCRH